MSRTLTFIGWDRMSRPVYKDNEERIWKDTDPRAHVPESIYSAYANNFDGEPDCPLHGSYQFFPKRMTW